MNDQQNLAAAEAAHSCTGSAYRKTRAPRRAEELIIGDLLFTWHGAQFSCVRFGLHCTSLPTSTNCRDFTSIPDREWYRDTKRNCHNMVFSKRIHKLADQLAPFRQVGFIPDGIDPMEVLRPCGDEDYDLWDSEFPVITHRSYHRPRLHRPVVANGFAGVMDIINGEPIFVPLAPMYAGIGLNRFGFEKWRIGGRNAVLLRQRHSRETYLYLYIYHNGRDEQGSGVGTKVKSDYDSGANIDLIRLRFDDVKDEPCTDITPQVHEDKLMFAPNRYWRTVGVLLIDLHAILTSFEDDPKCEEVKDKYISIKRDEQPYSGDYVVDRFVSQKFVIKTSLKANSKGSKRGANRIMQSKYLTYIRSISYVGYITSAYWVELYDKTLAELIADDLDAHLTRDVASEVRKLLIQQLWF